MPDDCRAGNAAGLVASCFLQNGRETLQHGYAGQQRDVADERKNSPVAGEGALLGMMLFACRRPWVGVRGDACCHRFLQAWLLIPFATLCKGFKLQLVSGHGVVNGRED